MTDLTDLRALIRIDLQDEDVTAERWANATLDRHILRALAEYSHVSPLEQKSTLSATPGSRDISLTTLTPRIRIFAVEWPTGEFPRAWVPFSLWADTLTMDVTSPPAAADDVDILWHKTHSMNGLKTYPASHDTIIATGAAAYAALEWASFASNRVNVGGEEVWGRYMDFANVRLEEFQASLRKLPAANTLRSSRLYTPQNTRLSSQTTDPGPG